MDQILNREPSSILTQEYLPSNIMTRVEDLEDLSRDKDLEDFPTVEDITGGRLGVFDLMISPAEGVQVTDPTSTAFTGYFIAGNGLLFGSDTYVAGNVVNGVIKTGFTDVGTLYAIDAIIEGTVIIGPGSEAGGWFIDATRIFNDGIILDSSIPAILVGDATDIMTGEGVFIGNDGGIYKMRIGDPADSYLLWDGTTLATAGQWIQSAGMNPALQEWQTNIVFSSVSDTQINWTSGTIILSDGTTYSIVSGNTGAMAALTYIYLDIAASLTVLQVTTTYTTATGDGKILIAAAQNATAGASVLVFSGQQPIINGGAQITALSILAGNIAAGAITASKISVTSLSAITASMGDLTIDGLLTMSGAAGAITIGTTPPTSASSGTGLWIDRTGVYSLDAGVQQTTLTAAGLTAGAGSVVIDINGISALGNNFIIDGTGLSIYGLNLAQYFEASNAGETRRTFLGMYLPQGATIPVWSILFTGPVGVNLVINGNAESGDLTSWTDADSAWDVVTDTDIYGTYAFKHLGSAEAFPGNLLQNVAVTAGTTYQLSFVQKHTLGILAPSIKLTWKTIAPAVISSNTVKGTNSSTYAVFEQTFVAPAGAVTVDIELVPSDPFGDDWFKAINFYPQSISSEIRVSDHHIDAIVDGVEYNLLNKRHVEQPGIYLYNSVAETVMTGNFTVPGGFIGRNRVLRVTLEGRFVNTSGVASTITPRIYYGPAGSETQIAAAAAFATTSVALNVRAFKYEAVIMQSSRYGSFITVDEFLYLDGSIPSRQTSDVAIPDPNLEHNLYLSMQLGAASLNFNLVSEVFIVESINTVEAEEAEEITLFSQQPATQCDATQINSAAATTNYGTAATFAVGESNAAVSTLRGLIKPSIDGIPINMEVSSVSLGVIISSDLATNARDFKLYRLLVPFVQLQATWNIRSTGNNWNTAGAGGSGTDYDPTVLATVSFGAAEAVGTLKTFDIDPVIFQGFLDGTYDYYGYLMKADTETNDAYVFNSPTATSMWLRPVHIVKGSIP